MTHDLQKMCLKQNKSDYIEFAHFNIAGKLYVCFVSSTWQALYLNVFKPGSVNNQYLVVILSIYTSLDVDVMQWWFIIQNTNIARMYPSAINYNQQILLMGGCDHDTSFSSVEMLNLSDEKPKWDSSLPSMKEKRHSFASALLNGKILWRHSSENATLNRVSF